jgi:hypothetical protein
MVPAVLAQDVLAVGVKGEATAHTGIQQVIGAGSARHRRGGWNNFNWQLERLDWRCGRGFLALLSGRLLSCVCCVCNVCKCYVCVCVCVYVCVMWVACVCVRVPERSICVSLALSGCGSARTNARIVSVLPSPILCVMRVHACVHTCMRVVMCVCVVHYKELETTNTSSPTTPPLVVMKRS